MTQVKFSDLSPEFQRALVQNGRAFALACQVLAEHYPGTVAEDWIAQISTLSKEQIEPYPADVIAFLVQALDRMVLDSASTCLYVDRIEGDP